MKQPAGWNIHNHHLDEEDGKSRVWSGAGLLTQAPVFQAGVPDECLLLKCY
jgi:hypothetical protein